MQLRDLSNRANGHKFVQSIEWENAIRVFVGIGRIVVNVIYCYIAHMCITWYHTETGVAMGIQQIVSWLALQVNTRGGDQRNPALGEWFAQWRPAY